MIRKPGLTLFVQTVILLCAALFVAQTVAATVVLSQPAPRPEITLLGEIAAQLQGPQYKLAPGLVMRRSASIPAAPQGLRTDTSFSTMLAAQMGVPANRIRFWYEPIRARPGLLGLLPTEMADGRTVNGVPVRDGEPIFIGRISASVFDGQDWTTLETAPRAAFTPWQQRVALLFAAQILFLLPLAWFFARRITRPIRGFAGAASRLGRGETVANIPEEGPLELRLASRALNTMQARIEGYLRERTAMIGAIAHDLRTPLARIAFRMEQAPDTLRIKVQADIDSMQQMIADTIAFVRGTSDRATHQQLDLAKLAERVVEAFSATGNTIAFTREGGAPARVNGNALALERLLANLLSNAVAFGSKVVLTVAQTDSGTSLIVLDNGPGIPPDQIDRMFEPFERGDPSRNRTNGGAGLGLAIARSIATSHDAHISLRNRREGGLEARVLFPPVEEG